MRYPPPARQRGGTALASRMQVGLLIVNVMVLAWVVLRGGGSAQPAPSAQPATAAAAGSGRGALTGHAEPLERNAADEALPIEIWARGLPEDSAAVEAVRGLLSDEERQALREMCGRTLYHGLQNVVVSHETGTWSFFATGDLPLMWLRDSAFQIGVLMPRIRRRPSLRRVVEGAIRAQAFYIAQDPYANGFYPEWRHPWDHNPSDRRLGRGGWVGVRNYELDSGAYYLNLLWNYYRTPGLHRPEALLADPLIFDAAATMVRLWVAEQRHNASSPYRFTELKNNGLGPPVGYTGMTWSGFRPSDDPNTYGFSVPSNMYAAGALQRALALNRAIWRNDEFGATASQLLADIEEGLRQHGPTTVGDGARVYAYEVDGLGGVLADFDDPNWPSLVALPLLGYAGYDPALYAATRARLLSPVNKYWLEGKDFKGMGSPHTSAGMAWALGTLSEVMTADSAEERVEKLRLLLKLQCGDGLMHESINVNNPTSCTRRWFEWANALSVVAIEQLVGEDCDAAAEAAYQARVAAREVKDTGASAAGYEARFHQPLEAAVQWDVKYESKVADWKGIGWTI